MQEGRTVKVANYEISKTIGVGTFSKVRAARHIPTGECVAIKVIEKKNIQDEGDHNRLNREIQILRKIRHPNVMQLYEIIQTGKHLFLVTELLANGELFDYIVEHNRLAEPQAAFFLQQLLNAVQHMHKLGIAHRDLKPENLLLDEKNNIKVVDFGLSNIYAQGEQLKTACGSPCYAAPEMVAGKPYSGLRTDLWSCGIILFAMICGYLPFQNDNNDLLYSKIMSGIFKIPQFVSPVARDLLLNILNVNPEARYSIEDIRRHPFCRPVLPVVPGVILGFSRMPIDPQILEQVVKAQSCEGLEEMLAANRHNQYTAIYHLQLLKKLRREGQSLVDYFLFNEKYLRGDTKLLKKILTKKPPAPAIPALRPSLQPKNRHSATRDELRPRVEERLSEQQASVERRRMYSRQREGEGSSRKEERVMRLKLGVGKGTRRSNSERADRKQFGGGVQFRRLKGQRP